eukprot:m.315895 g.315895  ORF g.315895 m.315895 type:complete len:315 (+) comp20282_c0_seq6:61-1005(+)
MLSLFSWVPLACCVQAVASAAGTAGGSRWKPHPQTRVCEEKYSPSCFGELENNVTLILSEAVIAMGWASNAILATPRGGDTLDINARVMSPKTVDNITDEGGLSVIYIDTNNLSRKYKEITSAGGHVGGSGARVNLMYYDTLGTGYVAFRGGAVICNTTEAKQEYWAAGWDAFYPNGSATPYYSLIKFQPDWMEIVSTGRFDIQSGRADWAPPSLERVDGKWRVEVPVAPSPPPAPPAPPAPPSAEKWQCSQCLHVYDPATDDPQHRKFEDLPDTWECPVCGAPKSAYRQIKFEDGSDGWAHADETPKTAGRSP